MGDGPLFCIGNETIPLLSLQRLLAFAVVTVEMPDQAQPNHR